MDAEWILWAGTVGLDTPIDERVDAALAAGCTSISIGFNDVERAADSGTDAAALAAHVRAKGIEPRVLDGITTWVEGTSPPKGSRVAADVGMNIAEDLGVGSVNLIAIGRGPWSTAAMVDRFGELCDRAAHFGCSVHIEFAPESGVPDLTTAWEIVENTGRPNGGVLFDTWHFHRSASDLEVLRRIPGDRVFATQISDAGGEVMGTLWEDTLHHRLLPGDGAIDLDVVLGALGATGLRLVGPEVFSDELLAMAPDEAATSSCARTRAAIDHALGAGWDR
jgi:sugar phosphate isomerase/epimerase